VAVLSIGEMFAKILAVFPFPPLVGERVTSRMLILPLISVLVLGVIFMQRELRLNKAPIWGRVLLLMGGYLMFHDLYQHLQAWRIRYLDSMVKLFPKVPFDPALHTLSNHADPVYFQVLLGGVVVAVLALVFLIVKSLRPQEPTAARITK
jgi:hypothetical protein